MVIAFFAVPVLAQNDEVIAVVTVTLDGKIIHTSVMNGPDWYDTQASMDAQAEDATVAITNLTDENIYATVCHIEEGCWVASVLIPGESTCTWTSNVTRPSAGIRLFTEAGVENAVEAGQLTGTVDDYLDNAEIPDYMDCLGLDESPEDDEASADDDNISLFRVMMQEKFGQN